MDLYPVDNWYSFCDLVKNWAYAEIGVSPNTEYVDADMILRSSKRQDTIDTIWEEVEGFYGESEEEGGEEEKG